MNSADPADHTNHEPPIDTSAATGETYAAAPPPTTDDSTSAPDDSIGEQANQHDPADESPEDGAEDDLVPRFRTTY